MNEVIAKACASRPEDRYRSAAEMHADLALLERGRSIRTQRAVAHAGRLALRTLPVALVLAVLGIVALNLGRKKLSPTSLPVEKTSVFVLPIRGGADIRAETATFEDGLPGRMTDAVTDSLALIEGVRVGPRKSGWVNRDEAECRREVGERFGHVVTGRVTNSAGQLRWEVTLYRSRPERALGGDLCRRHQRGDRARETGDCADCLQPGAGDFGAGPGPS